MIFQRNRLCKNIFNDRMIINTLIDAENSSTCASKHVGCVLFDYNGDDNIISTGYNKSVSCVQCNDIFQKIHGKWYYRKKSSDIEWTKDFFGTKHKEWSIKHEVHAEIMALTNKDPKAKCKHLCALVSWSPCLDCCKSLINAGVKKIIYINEFDNLKEVVDLCKECGVEIIKLRGENLETYESNRENK